MTGVALPVPALQGLLDDAAVFPPGNASLSAAVAAHRVHRTSWYRDLVGPLVLPATDLAGLAPLLRDDDALAVSITLPDGPDGIAGVLAQVADLPVDLTAVEVAVPAELTAEDLRTRLDRHSAGAGVDVIVEIPRSAERDRVLAAVAGRFRVKLRTGGVRADLYPDEAELAGTIRAVTAAGCPFKATAGLHHAIRNTDPNTGFEQHGFLNLVLAAAVAAEPRVAEEATVAALAERDGAVVAARIRNLGPERLRAARARLTSFGTCSITEPVDELVALGLLEPPGEGRMHDHH